MKKKIIIAVCVVCLVLVRIFTPYLGRPFLIKCYSRESSGKRYYLSNKLNNIHILEADDTIIKFIKYCTELEDVSVSEGHRSGEIIPVDVNDIANPNLKSLQILGEAVNLSSLNRCTELERLFLEIDDLNIEDISELKKLKYLTIYSNEINSLNKLNEFQNLEELELHCWDDDIDCADFSKLKNVEKMFLSSGGKITGLDKMDSVVELRIYSDQVTEDELCGMDSLEGVTVYHDKLSEKVESKLREKGVFVKY
ncbi:hypothetical protein [Ruminococcus albus]|uniref:Uncharacterized protein n=1 Tax=Ruminococcus albus TaxID=1264 RepID=A0A1I1QW36_RUMAL|nr:hypothetical protein [Ruminococcus albus]SFD26255.1 hypothetical protein SAMN02910406_03529 [Ruminococcus albus]